MKVSKGNAVQARAAGVAKGSGFMANEIDREGESVKKPQNKRFKETSKRLREGKEHHLSHRASLDWRLDQRRVCGAADPAEDAIVPIAELCAILAESRTGASLLAEQPGRTLDIRYDRQTPVAQYYPREGRDIVTLNPFRPRGDLVNILSRELRRVWQHHHGALVNPLGFDPDEAILINRAQAADAFMISVKVAWELKLSGNNEPWGWLAGSPMADIGRVFEQKAQADFRTLNNGEASRAAYDKFFDNSRTKMHDKRIIHQMLLDESGYMKQPGKTHKIAADLFSRLGEMPDGRNYFALKNARVPTDTQYTSVEDRSNANFLWFIKFERSFQEKEMQMIQTSVRLSAEIVDFARWSMQRSQTPSQGL